MSKQSWSRCGSALDWPFLVFSWVFSAWCSDKLHTVKSPGRQVLPQLAWDSTFPSPIMISGDIYLLGFYVFNSLTPQRRGTLLLLEMALFLSGWLTITCLPGLPTFHPPLLLSLPWILSFLGDTFQMFSLFTSKSCLTFKHKAVSTTCNACLNGTFHN